MGKLAVGSWFAAFALSAFAAGCAPHWTVVKQAVPNPMDASSRFYVDKVSLEGLRIGEKTEAEWMSEKEDETRQKWEGDKIAMTTEFVAGFNDARDDVPMVTGPAGSFTVKAHFVHYEPGFYAGVVSGPASIDAMVDILDAGGVVVDEFQITTQAGGMSAGERARICAKTLGAIAAKYVLKRVGK